MSVDFKYIESLLLQLLTSLTTTFTESELKEVQEFIDVGEYGLSLETLVDIINEENKKIPVASAKLVEELENTMLLDKEVFAEKLRGHVIDN